MNELITQEVCPECYAAEKRVTPLRNPGECLRNHTQYICGTCGRCICIECEPNRGLQRWNFPFHSLEHAKLYLRTADFTNKKACGIYRIGNDKGRSSYKIFVQPEDLILFLKRNPDKYCKEIAPLFSADEYREYPRTEVRKLRREEAERYLRERKSKGTEG